jgi:hypothetical protein
VSFLFSLLTRRKKHCVFFAPTLSGGGEREKREKRTRKSAKRRKEKRENVKSEFRVLSRSFFALFAFKIPLFVFFVP